MGSLQDLPHVDMMRPITKFASNVVTTERVADMCSMAFREATTGAPGPAFLEIGRDILDAHVPLENAIIPEAGRYRASTKSIGDPTTSTGSPSCSSTPRSPCVLLGSQVWTSRGHEAAIDFVRKLNIPAYMNGAARGTLPPGDPHHFHLTRRLRVQQRRRDPDRRHPVRLPHGLRQAPAARTRPSSRSTWTTRRSARTATSSLGLVGDPGAILAEVAKAADGPRRLGRATARVVAVRRCATRRSG